LQVPQPMTALHVCVTCRNPRSPGYHLEHPLIPGQTPLPAECRRCSKYRDERLEIFSETSFDRGEARQPKKPSPKASHRGESKTRMTCRFLNPTIVMLTNSSKMLNLIRREPLIVEEIDQAMSDDLMQESLVYWHNLEKCWKTSPMNTLAMLSFAIHHAREVHRIMTMIVRRMFLQTPLKQQMFVY